MDLSGKKIIVTGASGVLGQAVVRALVSAGAQVVGIDLAPTSNEVDGCPDNVGGCPESQISSTAASKAIDGCPGGFDGCPGSLMVGGVDLGSPAAAVEAVEGAATRLGGLHCLVNVAGGFRWEKLAEGDVATWDFMFNVNVRTAVNAVRAALPLLTPPGGRIVNIGAAGAIKAGTGMGAYAASKAGVAKLTEALAEELKDRHVTVNAVLPSIIDTPANRADMPDADHSRWVKPAQIADLIVFLLSERATAITGALIPIVGRV